MSKSRMSRSELSSAANRSWRWLLGLGVLFILLSFIGLGQLVGLTLISIVFLGFLFVIAGLAQFLDVFTSIKWKTSIGHGLVALFYMAIGGLIIYDPILASTIVTLLIAWIFIVIGIIRFIMALSLRADTAGWFFILISAVAALVLGILILSHWPMSGLWIIGMLISVELMISGWTYIFLAFAMRKSLQ
ncbi:MAG: DUF308 domain-containing protein [Legionellaceae bacterium]|nr:DUF308 domain-containing protein [Legionellaceae bacterium]